MLTFLLPRRADQEYQAPPFYQGELGYNPGFDGDDPEKAGLDGEEGLPGELRLRAQVQATAEDQHPGHPGALTTHWVSSYAACANIDAYHSQDGRKTVLVIDSCWRHVSLRLARPPH